jgi:hypothetical protein
MNLPNLAGHSFVLFLSRCFNVVSIRDYFSPYRFNFGDPFILATLRRSGEDSGWIFLNYTFRLNPATVAIVLIMLNFRGIDTSQIQVVGGIKWELKLVAFWGWLS